MTTTTGTTLFGSRLSPFVEKVVRALQLKRIPYTLVEPRSPLDFRRWNPRAGKMPVLELDGQREYDSTFILRRLDAVVPAPGLYAADPSTAARQRFLEDWSDEALYWYGMALRWCDANAADTAAQVAATLPVPALAHPLLRLVLRRQIGGQAWAQGLVRLPRAHPGRARPPARRAARLARRHPVLLRPAAERRGSGDHGAVPHVAERTHAARRRTDRHAPAARGLRAAGRRRHPGRVVGCGRPVRVCRAPASRCARWCSSRRCCARRCRGGA
jgi:glutathione S-transferase